MRLKKYGNIRFGYFFCVLAVSSVICGPIHLFNASCGFKSAYQKRFNQKIYLWKNLAVTIVYFCFEHGPLNRERIFHWIAIFLSLLKLCSYLQIKNKVRGNMGI